MSGCGRAHLVPAGIVPAAIATAIIDRGPRSNRSRATASTRAAPGAPQVAAMPTPAPVADTA